MKRVHFTLLLTLVAILPLAQAASLIETSGRVQTKPNVNQILFLIQSGNIGRAIDIYNEYTSSLGQYDFDLLQEMGLSLLDLGYRSGDPEIQLLTLFGAGISLNEKTLYLLEGAVRNKNPQLQLIALNFLNRYHTFEANKAVESAMRSDFLPIRLEAAFQLCSKKSPNAVAQTESLMAKLPDELLPIFPQFFAAVGDNISIRMLKRFMNNPNSAVRVEAVLSIAKHGRDDLLPIIRTLSKQHDPAQQEVCAFALGLMKDENSKEQLKVLSRSKNPSVAISALRSLYHLGDTEASEALQRFALNGDLFAISALGGVDGSEETLSVLSQHPNLTIRINASLALLERLDPRCLPGLQQILIRDSRDLAFIPNISLGKSMTAWKIVPSATLNLKETPVQHELSLKMREEALVAAADFQENVFLPLAKTLLEYEQNDLIPILARLLENMRTEGALELLKQYSQKAGAPLIRNYCNLALYRIGEKGPYFDNLKQWILSQQSIDLIGFRPMVPLTMRLSNGGYELTADDRSRILVESFESFLQTQDDRGIAILLQAIRSGNRNNKYVLAGLLLRATL